MNQELVRNISLPNDELLTDNALRERVDNFPTTPANAEVVEFVIDIVPEVVSAFQNDFWSNSVFFTIQFNNKIMELAFNAANFKHLLGLPTERKFIRLNVIDSILNMRPELKLQLQNAAWFTQISELLRDYFKGHIISHECASNEQEKLNWKKMAVKFFSLINLGMLEDGQSMMYSELRNKNSKGNPHHMLIKSLRNGELEDCQYHTDPYYEYQLALVMVEEKFNDVVLLTPKSLAIIRKPIDSRTKTRQRERTIFLEGLEYRYAGRPTIERKRGNKYGQ